MRVFLIAAVVALMSACGAYFEPETKNVGSFATDGGEEVKAPPVEFSGYVQKAFTITVDGEQFVDSEQFYTEFIERLIVPKYPSLEDIVITVEGQYGMDEFGAFSNVFMAPSRKEGDLFEAITDQHSKFTIEITPKALDETYKGRVILRIGLIVEKFEDSEHYCYVLYGLRDGIKLSDSSQPVVFDTFKTQLNTYKCEKTSDNSGLVIPSLEPVESPVPTVTP